MNIEKIRKDFPVLQREFNGMLPIYLDNACMTLRPRQVIQAITQYYEEFPACALRSHHKMSKLATAAVENSRKILSKFFNAKHQELIFSKNTTESMNLVAQSFKFKKGDVVLTSGKEHSSNLLPWQKMVKEKEIIHKIIPLTQDNELDMTAYEELLKKNNVRLVSINQTSNLDGVTNPIEKIIKLAHENNALVIIDGAQSAPHKEINIKKMNSDFFALSGHKMMGPTGTGLLIAKQEALKELKPFIVGGETVYNSTYKTAEYESVPSLFEAGLQNYSGIIGMGAAAKYLSSIGMKNILKHEQVLNKQVDELLRQHKEISFIGPNDPDKRGGITNFNINNADPHVVAMMLDETKNIMLRSGMHCCHSWFNSQFNKQNIKGSVRSSLYLYNTKEEINLFEDALNKLMPLWKQK